MAANSYTCALPEHFLYAACIKGEPGAHALCIDEKGYEEHLIEFLAEEIRAGSFIQRVTCEEGQAMLKAFREWSDRE